jgi:glucose/arabinose dehydrogenase
LPVPAPATSLRFFGNGVGDIDRVKIPLDAAGTSKRADIGAGDFTLEWWMRALPGENPADDDGCGLNDGWITGNIVFDRDVYDAGDHGDYGVSLKGGRVAFGVAVGNNGTTICGTIDVTDGAWHHVAVTRQASNGRLRIYVDGVLDGEALGSAGNASYRDGRPTAYENSDPFLVIGAEKHDAGPAYPSYRGWIDEIRISTIQRYTGSGFTRPLSPFVTDGNTAALYHLDEGAGDVVGDVSGGNSHGTRMFGGNPAGPEWSADGAPLDSARRVTLEEVVTGAGRPVAIANAGDGRLFVADANGRILVYAVTETGPLTPLGTFLDIRDRVLCCGERGLLGLAFHPDYGTNGYFVVYYTRKDDGDVVIARFRVATDASGAPITDSNTADPGSESILLTIEHSIHTNHNGGGLAFALDGYLYAAVGDGGGGGDPLQSGQNLGTLLGKVLRLALDVSGGSAPYHTIPSSNPFVASAGARPEIWAWGLRNPWRISFDRLTGDLFIADVGQGNREEVNFQPAGADGGANYGWPRMEGTACYNPGSGCQTGSLVLPVLEYGHGDGCSITGGYRYRGTRTPTLHGTYLFGDFCSKRIWAGIQGANGAWSRTDLLSTALSITTFGEDAAGEVYVAHIGGSVHRVVRVRPRLTVTRSGAGTGTVQGPGGLDCGVVCSVVYDPGQTVTLTATVPASSWLAGWSGACGGTDDCVVVMDGDRAVTVTLNTRPIFQFSAANYTTNEDWGSATITVERLHSTAGTATIDYAIAPGTATAPPAADADFAGPGSALTGTLTFAPGQSTRSFTIPIVNDTRAEGPETILLSLHNPGSGALLGARATAVLTVVNHDAPGTFKFGQAAYNVSEGSSSAQVAVLRSNGAADAEVAWSIVPAGTTAALGTDYATPNGALAGTLTFAAHVGMQALPITLLRQSDTLADGPRTIKIQLSNPQPAAFAGLAAPTTTILTITDNDSAGSLQFNPSALSVSEAAVSAKAILTVTRTQKAGGVTVNWAVVPGESTAVLGTDFGGPASGQLVFAADVLSQAIEIPLIDRPGAQGSRILRVRLTGPTGGATIGGQATATLTITDDELGVRFGQATYAATEGSGNAAITVIRTGPTTSGFTVNYTTGDPSDTATPAAPGAACAAGADYRPIVSGSLPFNPGEMAKTFWVPLCEDSVEEGAETLTLRLTGVTASVGTAHLGDPSAATLTIQENDEGGVFKWSAATYSTNEGAGQVVLTVTRSGGSAAGAKVDYVIAGGSATAPPGGGADFNGPAPSGSLTGTLTFPANVPSQSVTIPLLNDAAIEPNETFTVTLQHPQGGAVVGSPAQALVTIVDNDRIGMVQFGQATAAAQEYATSVTLTVTRTGSTSLGASVDYQIAGDTAAVDPTALAGTVTFSAGQWSRSLVIPLLDDANTDGNSTLTVTLKEPVIGGLALGTPNPATVTLIDEEGTVQFASGVFAVNESQGSATITLTRTGGTAKAVTVQVATGDPGDSATPAPTPGACATGADYRPIPSAALTFNPSETVKTFSVQLCGDSAVETSNPEVVTLRLLSVTPPATLGAQVTALLQIQENDAGGTVAFSHSSYSVSEGSSTATLTTLRTGGAAGSVSVPWSLGGDAIAGTDYLVPTGGPIQFGPNQTVAYLQIPILNDALVDGARTLIVTLGSPAGGAALGSPSVTALRIDDNEPVVRFSSAAYAVGESSNSVTVTVLRQGPTSTQAVVRLESTGTGSAEAGGCGTGDYGAVAVDVTFPPGQTSQFVPITLCPDSAVDGTETIDLVLKNPVGATLGSPNTVRVTIGEDDAAGTLQFAVAATTVSEAQGAASILVTRTGGKASAVTVTWAVAGGTAAHDNTPGPGVDYTGPTSGTLTFGLEDMSEELTIPVVNRAGVQGPRTITLLLSTPGGGGALGVQTTTTLWILDAD